MNYKECKECPEISEVPMKFGDGWYLPIFWCNKNNIACEDVEQCDLKNEKT